jgi:HlyD family secretion protein
MNKLKWAAVAAVAAALAGGALWWSQRSRADEVQYRTAKIERGNLQATVSASGAVNPVTQVSVGTQVSGQIKELFVDFNSEVKAGQLIAQIDPETFDYRVRQAQADVDAARAAVLTAQANGAASSAGVSRAQVDVDEAKRDYERKKSLVEKQFIAASEADKARALVNTTTEQLKSAQAQLGVTQAQIKSAQANVAQREAALAQAKIDLGRTKITSPVNGIVIKRTVERGQTVAASLQAPELFVIAQNLSDMQVDASIDEADVGRIRTGQRASFTVDAFPGQTFDGDVRQVRKAAQTVANVVTYIAVVAFQNTGNRLLPGMTANVRIVTDTRENVLKIPNAALRVKIAGVEPAQPAGSAPAPASPASPGASGASTGDARRFSFFSEAIAQPADAGLGPGGGMAAMRERLVSELQLSSEQQGKLDAIGQDMRPKFMALRDMDDAERSAVREKLMAEMQQKISAMLTPEQRTKYEQMPQPVRAGQGGAAATAVASTPSATNSIATRADSMKASGLKDSKNEAVAASTASAATKASAPTAPSAAVPASGTSASGFGGGPLAEFRARLVSELQLSSDQQAKVDAIYTEVRPKFMALRDMAAEERGKARERIMADVRARIGDVLTPEQKNKYQALLVEAGSRTNSRGRIYLLGANSQPVAYNVRLGVSDGSMTELLVSPNSPNAEVFKEGAQVIVGTSTPGAAGAAGGSGGNAARGGAPGSPPGGGPRLPF